jgi:hypothetical protein
MVYLNVDFRAVERRLIHDLIEDAGFGLNRGRTVVEFFLQKRDDIVTSGRIGVEEKKVRVVKKGLAWRLSRTVSAHVKCIYSNVLKQLTKRPTKGVVATTGHVRQLPHPLPDTAA